MVGYQVIVDDTIHQLQEHDLVLKIEDDLRDYLLYKIVLLEDRHKAW